MSEPSAKIVADSISPNEDRLTTMEVVMHRFVLAEFNTHRVFSRNSASSRAIPIEKRMSAVLNDCAFPLKWGRNQKGMQAEEELSFEESCKARGLWERAATNAVLIAQELRELGLHKQVTNRLLEPFLWHTVVVSSTEWDNFFTQRCSPLAQPEIRQTAEAMREALRASKPQLVSYGEYHLPYVQDDEKSLDLLKQVKFSVARCARVSYLTHDGVRSHEKDFELYERLRSASPPHASPFEHVARPSNLATGNFKGWLQLRHEVGL